MFFSIYPQTYKSEEDFYNDIAKIKKSFASIFYGDENKKECKRVKDVMLNSNAPLCFSPGENSNLVIYDDDSQGASLGLFSSIVKELQIPCEITSSLRGKEHTYIYFDNPKQKEIFVGLFSKKRLQSIENPNGLGYDLIKDNQVCYEGYGSNRTQACFKEEIDSKWTKEKFEEFCNRVSILINSKNENKIVFKKGDFSRVYTPNEDVKSLCDQILEEKENQTSFEDLKEIFLKKIAEHLIPNYLVTTQNQSVKYLLLNGDFKPLKGENKEIGRNNALFILRQYLIQSGVEDPVKIREILFFLQMILFEEPFTEDSTEFSIGVCSDRYITKEVEKYPFAYISSYLRANPQSASSDLYINYDASSSDMGRFLEITYNENNEPYVSFIQDKTILQKIIENNPVYRVKYMAFNVKKQIYVWPSKWSVKCLSPIRVIYGGYPVVNDGPLITQEEDMTYLDLSVFSYSSVVRNYKNLPTNLGHIKDCCPTIFKILVNISSDPTLKSISPIFKRLKYSILFGDPLYYNLILSGIGGVGKTLFAGGLMPRFFKDPIHREPHDLKQRLKNQNDFVRQVKPDPIHKTSMMELVKNNWNYYVNAGYLYVEEMGKAPPSMTSSEIVETYCESLKPFTRSGREATRKEKFEGEKTVTSNLVFNCACINKLDLSLDNEDNRRAVLLEASPVYKLDKNKEYYEKKLDEEFPIFVSILMNTTFFEDLSEGLDEDNPASWDSQMKRRVEADELGDDVDLIREMISYAEKTKGDLTHFFKNILEDRSLSDLPNSVQFAYLSGFPPVSDSTEESEVRDKLSKMMDKNLSAPSYFLVKKWRSLVYKDIKSYNLPPRTLRELKENMIRLIKKGVIGQQYNKLEIRSKE